ncbi:glutathione-dependent formaldehyde-activating GFA [Xylariaceae sp. FL0016]|nr:glutathione-dependent formaldehyde-activating GFA [Xylariaceae sp. FL0016]
MSQPSVANFPKPTSITGGCLCGAIRYRVDFPKDHDFLKSSGTCHCTQCRRQTGALFYAAHSVFLAHLTYLNPANTLTKYHATPGIERAFCGRCGSFLYWRNEAKEDMGLAVGSVDPEFLVGGDGQAGFGFALANMAGDNEWCENVIPGVTDGMTGDDRGDKWATNKEARIRM